MSTRYWRRYVRGNPQRRCYLPNLYIKLVKDDNSPPNQLNFKVPVQMTNNIMRSYLEKIYNIPIAEVRSVITCGKTGMSPSNKELIKLEDDYRRVFVKLKEGFYFNYPNLFPEIKKKEERKEIEEAKEQMKKSAEEYKKLSRGELPTWFKI